jgi:hypothetical protein
VNEQTNATTEAPCSGVDRYFKITKRGSTVGREIRGGLVTSYIESAAGVGDGPHRAREHRHRRLLPADDLPGPAGLDRAVRGGHSRVVRGKATDVHPLLWAVAVMFVIYFAIEPIEQLLT